MLSLRCRSLSTRMMGMAVIAAIGVLLTVLPACNQPRQGQKQPPTVAPRGGQPVLHAVYADELRATMRELNRAASDQVWWQIYNTAGPTVDMSQMAETADKMANVAANRLPNLVGPDQLPPDQLQIYRNLAQRLHSEAVILKQESDRNELTAAQATMNQIINTCNTCHTLFRGVAGPIDH